MFSLIWLFSNMENILSHLVSSEERQGAEVGVAAKREGKKFKHPTDDELIQVSTASRASHTPVSCTSPEIQMDFSCKKNLRFTPQELYWNHIKIY